MAGFEVITYGRFWVIAEDTEECFGFRFERVIKLALSNL
jgi:hypothetical protein